MKPTAGSGQESNSLPALALCSATRLLLSNALAQCADLRLVKVADGSPDNWIFFGRDLPPGVDVLDFYLVSELRPLLHRWSGDTSKWTPLAKLWLNPAKTSTGDDRTLQEVA